MLEVLTGATGALGAHILSQLCSDDAVQAVVCLVRARNDENAKDRVIENVTRHASLKDSRKISAVACTFSSDRLGISDSMRSYIQSRATALIHVSFLVNILQRDSGIQVLIVKFLTRELCIRPIFADANLH